MRARKTRGRTAEIERKTDRYPSDFIGEEWERIAASLAKPAKRAGRLEVEVQVVLNAIHYMTRPGRLDALGRQLADATEGFPALANGVLVVLVLRATDAVPVYPRHRADDGPRAGRGDGASKKTVGRKRRVMVHSVVMDIVRRVDSELGFKVVPRRWVGEPTFGRFTRWRRLVRDYEERGALSEVMIHVPHGKPLPAPHNPLRHFPNRLLEKQRR